MSGINGANKTTGSVVQKALEQQAQFMSRLTGQNSAAAQATSTPRTPDKHELAEQQTEARGDKLADAGLSRNTRDNPTPTPSAAGGSTPVV